MIVIAKGEVHDGFAHPIRPLWHIFEQLFFGRWNFFRCFLLLIVIDDQALSHRMAGGPRAGGLGAAKAHIHVIIVRSKLNIFIDLVLIMGILFRERRLFVIGEFHGEVRIAGVMLEGIGCWQSLIKSFHIIWSSVFVVSNAALEATAVVLTVLDLILH